MTRRAEILLPLFFAACGLLPHLLFSLDTGHATWMETGWDENSYLAFTHAGRIETYRLFGVCIYKAILFMLGGSDGAAMVAMDVLLPALCAFLAVKVARALGYAKAAVPAIFLLLPLTFLSFSDIGVFSPVLKSVSPFAGGNLPESLRTFIPNLQMTFLPLYRTPEPQASLIVVLAAFLALLGYQARAGRRELAGIAIVMALLPFIYVSMGIAVLLLAGGYGLLQAVTQRRFALLAAFAGGLCWYGLLFMAKMQGGNAVSLVFASRLPLLAPSMLWGMAGLFYIVYRHRAAPFAIPAALQMAMAAFAVPLVTLGQQVVTGMMIQSRNWEFYANYYFVAFGILLLAPVLLPKLEGRWFMRYARVAPLLLAIMVVGAQVQSYLRFSVRNLEVLATVELIGNLQRQGVLAQREILLDNPAQEAGIINRMRGHAPDMMAGHLSAMMALGPQLGHYYLPQDMPDRRQGYALFRRRGADPAAFTATVADQVSKGICGPDLLYFYNMMDCSGMLSDYRALRVTDIMKGLPALRDDYARYLASDDTQLARTVFVTQKREPDGKPLASATAGKLRPVTVYAYE